MTSDEALMLEFQGGSREAFEELFSRYREPLFGFFRRRLQNQSPERAEDLAQETFLAVIKAAHRYEPRSLVRTYFYGIAMKQLFAVRRRQAKDGPPLEEDMALGADQQPDTCLWVRQALGKLDPTDREILMLREYEQLSYAEISDLLRIPVNTVRSRLFRSRMALKTLLQAESPNKVPPNEVTTAAATSRYQRVTPVTEEEAQR